MRLLCTGDLHLGRRSSRLPTGMDGRAHSSAACWGRIVDFALESAVDVVILSGDLVDRDNRFYEAIGPLEDGVRRLAAAGVTTVAVAGNHDYDVLPRIASGFAPETFRLLGRGGVWERVTVRRNGDVLHLDGWSFPERYVRESPVASYGLPVPDDGPVVGVLHADLDQPGSPYAPVSLGELRGRGVDFWLLGHIHAPSLHEAPGAASVLYPGSPQALDPGETGAHGVWLVDVEPGRRFRARQVPFSTVRYDEVVVDVSGVEELGEVDGRIVEGVRAHLSSLAEAGGALRCVPCRVRLIGRTALHRELGAYLEPMIRDLEPSAGDVTAVVETIEIQTRPARELTELARGEDPVGVLARLLLALDAGTEGRGVAADGPAVDHGSWLGEAERLLAAAEREADQVVRAPAYRALVDARRDPDGRAAAEPLSARAALARQATLLLDELLAQKEAEG